MRQMRSRPCGAPASCCIFPARSPECHFRKRDAVTQFVMVPEATIRELEKQMAAFQAAYDEVQRLYLAVVSSPGRAAFPDSHAPLAPRRSAPTPAPSPTPTRHVAADPEPVAESNLNRMAKYTIVRGGTGPSYADVVDEEVPDDEFSLDHVWEVITPLLGNPVPEKRSDRNYTLRRSFKMDPRRRFEPVEGKKDWYRRTRRQSVLDLVAKREATAGASTPEAASQKTSG